MKCKVIPVIRLWPTSQQPGPSGVSVSTIYISLEYILLLCCSVLTPVFNQVSTWPYEFIFPWIPFLTLFPSNSTRDTLGGIPHLIWLVPAFDTRNTGSPYEDINRMWFGSFHGSTQRKAWTEKASKTNTKSLSNFPKWWCLPNWV